MIHRGNYSNPKSSDIDNESESDSADEHEGDDEFGEGELTEEF